MLGFLALLLIIWVILIIIGIVIKGLFWLVIIGVILFLATGVYAWIKRESFRR